MKTVKGKTDDLAPAQMKAATFSIFHFSFFILPFAFLAAGCPGSRQTPPLSQFAATIRIYEVPFDSQFSVVEPPASKQSQATSWLWDFGDGSTSTEQSPTHTYAEAGAYTVSLTATDARGNSSMTVIPNYVYGLASERLEGSEAGEEMEIAGIPFVWAPPGTFQMGADDPETATNWFDAVPSHEVTISRGFWMSKTEITQKQYFEVTGENNSFFTLFNDGNSDLPVETVTWDDAQGFVRLINEQNDEGVFRLPTEAEWEYAVRAGTDTDYHFGDELFVEDGILSHGWTNVNAGGSTHVVGELLSNDWGLLDMHGNVWEWCLDRYDPMYYSVSPPLDPFGPDLGIFRAARGGSWYHQPAAGASPGRFPFLTNAIFSYLGFRIIMQ